MFEVQAIGSAGPTPPGASGSQQDSRVFLLGARALIAEIEWPAGTTCTGLRLTRIWTGRKQRIVCEHVFDLTSPSGTIELPLQSVVGAVSRADGISRRAVLSNDAILGLYLPDARRDAVWCSPDRDPDLPCAAVFFDPQRLHRLLGRTAAAPRWAIKEKRADVHGACDVRLRSYRLGRRCVVHLRRSDNKTQGLYLKTVRRLPAPWHIDRLRDLAQWLPPRSAGVVRIPEILDYLPEERLLITVGVGPPSIAPQYDAAARAQDARVLAVLHAATCRPDEPTHSPQDELETVARWGRVLPLLRLDADVARLQAIHARLGDSPVHLDAADMTLIHRDFYHAQLLRRDAEVWLVDLDTLSRGHPELDIATYFAHVMLDAALKSGLDWARGNGLGEFLETYRSYGGVVEHDRLAWYLSCALARLGSLHLARGVDRSVIAKLWDVAEALAGDPRGTLETQMASDSSGVFDQGSS